MNDLDQLKTLLFGAEKQALDSITDRVQRRETRAADVADVLPEAVHLSHRRGDDLVATLREPVGECLQKSLRDEPERYADALYPVMGPAIRKSIMSALRAFAQQINETIEQSLSARGIKWRFEAWRSGIPFGEYVVQRTLLYRIEQAYLISRENGLLIGHVHHEASKIKDSDAVSAMFTAIQDFIKESFSPDRSGRLETADMGEFTLWAVHGPHALLVCVIRGVPPRALRSDLSSMLERIHFRYADAIRDYTGDTSTMAGVEEELAGCLRFEAMQQPDDDKRRSKLPLFIVVILLAALLGFLGLNNWKVLQQKRVLENVIATTPGWYTSSLEYDDGVYYVRGLRDPLAAPISEIVTAAGLNDTQLVGDLRPFQSLDPGIIILRARTSLAPPVGVSVSIDNDSIILVGTAPFRWIAEAEQKANSGLLQVPINLDAVTPVEREELVLAVEANREARFSFVDGTILMESDAARLEQHAVRIGQLAREAAYIGARLQITIIGQTDGIGTPERNRELAEQRVAVASSLLIEQGVPDALLERSYMIVAASEATPDPEKRRVDITIDLPTAAVAAPTPQ